MRFVSVKWMERSAAWMIGLAVVTSLSTAASADPERVGTGIAPERDEIARPRSCGEPACQDVRLVASRQDADFKPVDLRLDLGDVAIATMEGVWLRRGPTLRNEPIMVSPIVVGDALTLSLGGRF